jgi:MoxR-like ATPase
MSALVGDCLRHRLVLSYEALAEGLSADELVQRIVKKIALPEQPLSSAG